MDIWDEKREEWVCLNHQYIVDAESVMLMLFTVFSLRYSETDTLTCYSGHERRCQRANKGEWEREERFRDGDNIKQIDCGIMYFVIEMLRLCLVRWYSDREFSFNINYMLRLLLMAFNALQTSPVLFVARIIFATHENNFPWISSICLM